MFKRDFGGSRNLLGNKDRKKLRASLLSRFAVTEAELDDIVLPKSQEVTLLKVQGSKLQIYFVGDYPICFDEAGPSPASSQIYPTINLLAKLPTLLPSFVIQAPVSRFVLGGADLMVPGILVPHDISVLYPEETLAVGAPMSVRVWGNPIPFAVGRCLINRRGLLAKKGRGLQLCHTFGDCLWKMGGCIFPNSGFSLNFVTMLNEAKDGEGSTSSSCITQDKQMFPDVATIHQLPNNSYDNGEEETQQTSRPPAPTTQGGDDDGWDEPGGGCSHPKENEPEAAAAAPHDTDVIDDPVSSPPTPSRSPAAAAIASSPEAAPSSSAKRVDESPTPLTSSSSSINAVPTKIQLTDPVLADKLYELCLLETLHVSVQDSMLPMQASAIYSKMCEALGAVAKGQAFLTFAIDALKGEGEGGQMASPTLLKDLMAAKSVVHCDIKKTSAKSLAKFLKVTAKSTKLIQIKDVRGEQMVMSVDRSAPAYTQYKPLSSHDYKAAAATAAAAAAAAQTSNTATAAAHPPSGGTKQVEKEGGSSSSGYVVLELFMPDSSSFAPIFEDATPGFQRKYYTAGECKAALSSYLKKHCQQGRCDEKAVVVDAVLSKCLSSKKKEGQEEFPAGSEVARAVLSNAFMARLAAYHVIASGPNELEHAAVHRGKVTPISVKHVVRQGRRAGTAITNFQPYGISEKALSETLSRALAASASTFEVTGAAKGKVKPLGVLVQGSFVDKVAQILKSDFGIPVKCIDAK